MSAEHLVLTLFICLTATRNDEHPFVDACDEVPGEDSTCAFREELKTEPVQ
jgi:hypothetical protein